MAVNEAHIRVRVRYQETDQMGIVYHSNYLVWFEIARSELFRQNGLPYSKIEEQDIIMPAVRASCDYRAPAHYDEEIEIYAWVEEVRNVSVTFGYKAVRVSDDRLVVEGSTKHAYLTDKERKIVRAPEKIQRMLEAIVVRK